MNLDFKLPASDIREQLLSCIGSITYPAVVLDEHLKTVCKNKAFSKRVRGLRNGAYVKRFMNPDDYRNLCNMQEGQTLYVGMMCGAKVSGAVAFASAGRRLIVLHRLNSDIRHSIDRLYERMSGYDIQVVGGESGSLMHPLDDEMIDLFAERTTDAYSLRDVTFFDAVSVVYKLVHSINDRMGTAGCIKTSIGSDGFVSYGSEKDFALVLGTLLSLCSANSWGDIDVSMKEDPTSSCILVSAEIFPEVVSRLKECFDRLDSALVSEDDIGFVIYTLRLLTDGNIWNFRLDFDSGRTVFRLTLPMTEPFATMRLHDISDEYIRLVIDKLF